MDELFTRAEQYQKELIVLQLKDLPADSKLPSQEPTRDFLKRLELEGQRVPIQVTNEADGSWWVLDGIRRIKGLRLLGDETIEAIWYRDVGHLERASWAVSTNASRSDNPVRNAQMIAELEAELRGTPEICAILGLTTSEVERCRKIGKLEPELKAAVEEGRMSITTAEEAAKLKPNRRQLLVEKAKSGEKITGKDVRETKAAQTAAAMAALSAKLPTVSLPSLAKQFVVTDGRTVYRNGKEVYASVSEANSVLVEAGGGFKVYELIAVRPA